MQRPESPRAGQPPPGYERREQELREEIRVIPIQRLAERSGADLSGRDELRLMLYGSPVVCRCPDLIFHDGAGNPLPEFQQLLLLYYLACADGVPEAGRWVSFADLPGGRMYSAAFQGYSGDEIVRAFDTDLPRFQRACERAGGQSASDGDAAYTFQALPRVAVKFVYWLGDEDFPSSCKILFDASATHYVPVDACAIIGSTLTKRILKMESGL